MALNVPRHRNQPFRTMLFENYSRSEQSLFTTMAVIVLEGVSTRKVVRVTEEMCGTSFSKSAVSEICKSLDAYVDKFRNRPLTDSYPFFTVDTTYFKVRENHR
ncbi:MAG: transposase [Desulfovibrio sp.]